MVRFTDQVSEALFEYVIHTRLKPRGRTPDEVRLGCQITEDMYMPLAMFSAAMQCTTGPDLSIALAQYGGCGVIPRSLSQEDRVDAVKKVKRAKAGFVYDTINVTPDTPIAEVEKIRKETGYSSFPVVGDDGKLEGLLTEKRYRRDRDSVLPVSARMKPVSEMKLGEDGISLGEANNKLLEFGIGILPIVDRNGTYLCSVFWQDLQKHLDYPDEFVDDKGRYRTFVAASMFPNDFDVVEQLVKEGADGIVVDTADAKNPLMVDAIKRYLTLDVPVIGGNIIDREGFYLVARAGAHMAKIGQGPGYGCTTRRKKSQGRAQATAIRDCTAARDRFAKRKRGRYVNLCADGGMEETGDMGVAFALGANCLMHGKYFCGMTESAAPMVTRTFGVDVPDNPSIQTIAVDFKWYWGEASARGKNIDRYGHADPKTFTTEGNEGPVPHVGSIHKVFPADIQTLKNTLFGSGAFDTKEFNEKALLERQSHGSHIEGGSKVMRS